MRKLTALLLAALMLLFAASALADMTTIPDTSLSLDLGDAEELELTEEDVDADVVMAFCNDDETLEGMIYVYAADDLTNEDILSQVSEEEGTTAAGLTTINGIETAYQTLTLDGENYVAYYLIDGDLLVIFDFWYADDAAAQQSGAIMATLTAN